MIRLWPRRRRTRVALVVVLSLPIVILVAFGWYMMDVPGSSFEGTLTPLTSEQTTVRDRLRGHVERLAGEIGVRNFEHPAALTASREYIVGEFEKIASDTDSVAVVVTHDFVARGRTFSNIEFATKRRSPSSAAEEIVVVGAHYDTAQGSPGANDNASGVAALLELARLAAKEQFARTIRFVAFANEEAPFFRGAGMGSVHDAQACRRRGDDVVAMLSLETMGYYSDVDGSQRYPSPLSWFYPDRANFVAFVGNLDSRDLVHDVVRAFRASVEFPSEGVAAPEALGGIGDSDHRSYWNAGYPAVMVTDTARFRDPEYHRPTDLPPRLDYARLSRVVSGLVGVLRNLGRAN